MVGDLIKEQNKPMDFNITEYEKLIDMILDFILLLTFRKRTFVRFWYSIQEEYLQLSENGIKIILPLSTTHPCDIRFF